MTHAPGEASYAGAFLARLMAERTIPRPQAMSMIRAALRLYSDDVASLKAFDRGFRRVTVEYDPNNPDRFIVRDLLGENAA